MPKGRIKQAYQRKKVLSAYNKGLKKAGGPKTKKGKQVLKSYGGPKKARKKR